MKRLVLLVGVFFFIVFQVKATDLNTFYTKSDLFLKKHVKNGSVAYKNIKADMTEVRALYQAIGGMSLTTATDAEKKAFYINAYNLIVIYWVAEYYPLKSPLDKSGFFDKVKHKVAGEELSLNALEIKKLLLPYKDGRFHFVLACAAKSCPPLASYALLPTKLDQQLNERTTIAINNDEWLRVNNTEKRVEFSKIFDWYKGDFTQNGKTAIDWVNQFRKVKIPATYQVGYYEYNWSLNEQ